MKYKEHFELIKKPMTEDGSKLGLELELKQVKPFDFSKLNLVDNNIVESINKKVYENLGIAEDTLILREALYKASMYDKVCKDLGCPLEVVFKAIEDGIVIKGDINEYGTMTLWLDNKPLEALVGEKLDFEEPELIKFNVWCFSCHGGSYRGCVSLKDYKNTWWLKGEVK